MSSFTDYAAPLPTGGVPRVKLDPAGGVVAGGVYGSVWTRDSLFALLGINPEDRHG